MTDIPDFIDNLCAKLEPYVRSALQGMPSMKTVDNAPIVDTNELEKAVAEDEPDKDVAKFLVEAIQEVFNPPNQDLLNESRVRLYTEIIAAGWYQTLDFSSKSKETISLRDCLLPDFGEAKRPWNVNIGRLCLSQIQVEDILRKFGKDNINDRFELPLLTEGYISREGNNYKLHPGKP